MRWTSRLDHLLVGNILSCISREELEANILRSSDRSDMDDVCLGIGGGHMVFEFSQALVGIWVVFLFKTEMVFAWECRQCRESKTYTK